MNAKRKTKKTEEIYFKTVIYRLNQQRETLKTKFRNVTKNFSKNLLLPLKPILKKIKIKSRKTKTFTTLTGLEKKDLKKLQKILFTAFLTDIYVS